MTVANVQYKLRIVHLFHILDLVMIARLTLCQAHTVPWGPVVAFVPAR